MEKNNTISRGEKRTSTVVKSEGHYWETWSWSRKIVCTFQCSSEEAMLITTHQAKFAVLLREKRSVGLEAKGFDICNCNNNTKQFQKYR